MKKANLQIWGVLVLICLPFLMVVFGTDFFHSAANSHKIQLELISRVFKVNDDIDEEILRQKLMSYSNYDQLARLTTEAEGLCADVTEQLLEAIPTESKGLISSYCAEEERRLRAVEKFKLKNAVIRNSLQYIPDILKRIDAHPHDVLAYSTYSKVLRYALDARSDVREEAVADLKKMARAPAKASIREAVANFQMHISIVLNAVKEERAAEHLIVYTADAENTFTKIVDEFHRSYEKQERISAFVRLSLFVLSTIFAVILVSVFTALQGTRVRLQEANATLEKNVEARTAELKNAMDELSEKQQMLVQVSKMSALGEMAGGIAHEINTPLTTISLNTELMEAYIDSEDAMKPLLNIRSTVARISKIIQGLKRFSHAGKGQVGSLATFGNLVEDTLCLCGEKLKHSSIEFRWDHAADDTVLLCQPEQIVQILLNLISNAVDAIKGTESPWIKVAVNELEDEIEITVENSGPAIPAEVRAKLMQPFFTTKEVGKGTGLGLSISSGIAKAHGGSLTLAENSEHTRFVLRLPPPTKSLSAAG